jgi:hypothetical protein
MYVCLCAYVYVYVKYIENMETKKECLVLQMVINKGWTRTGI